MSDVPDHGADSPLAGRALAAFRFDTRLALVRSLALAIPLMGLGAGAAVTGLRHLQLRVPARVFAGSPTFQLADPASSAWQVLPWEQGLMVGGLVLVVLSNLVLIRALYRNLAVERFILLRADGLVRQVDRTYTLIAWDDVEHVGYDAARGKVVLEMRAGGELTLDDRYAGVSSEELAKLMRDVHRKAIWGLLACLCLLVACSAPASEAAEPEASTGTESVAEVPAAPPPEDGGAEPTTEPATEPAVEEAVSEPPAEAAPLEPAYDGPEALLCGCGCCSGAPSAVRCVATEAALRREVAADERVRRQPGCRAAGCSVGTRLRVCTSTP